MRKPGTAYVVAPVNKDGGAVATIHLLGSGGSHRGAVRLDYESADFLHYELGQLLAAETLRRLRKSADDLKVFNATC